jgi:hypothetical protein
MSGVVDRKFIVLLVRYSVAKNDLRPGLPRLWGTLAQSLALLRRSLNSSATEPFHAEAAGLWPTCANPLKPSQLYGGKIGSE